MKSLLASVVLMIFVAGCDQPGTENTQSQVAGNTAEEQVEAPPERQPEERPQTPEGTSITAKAVEILNMLVVASETTEGNGIDPIAASLNWQKLSPEQAAGANAEVAYIALKQQEGGILVGHQGDKGGWSIVVMEAFARDVFMDEVDQTFSFEKIRNEFLPATEITFYYAKEKKSGTLLGVLSLTTSDHPKVSGYGTIGWLTIEQWNQANRR